MANFTTDGKNCIERELFISPVIFEDLLSRFDIVKTSQWISDNSYIKVCLQFPDDLLSISSKVYEEIKKRVDVDLYILGDTSYASCCVDTVAAMHVQANAVVHYGHTCFSKANIPVYMVLPKYKLDIQSIMNVLKNFYSTTGNNKVCLFYGAEFEHCKDDILKSWFRHYPDSYVGDIQDEDHKDKLFGRVVKDATGQIHPIDILTETNCVFIGSRGQTIFNFTTSIPAKTWHQLDPETNNLNHLVETAWFKRRHFLVEKCKDASVIGILVCKLAGDQTKDIISRMKQLCKVNGKKSYIVSVGKPNVAKLANFPEIDIYVMIACPENDLYSNRDFYKPLVYPFELEVALNSNRQSYFTSLISDYDELLPGKRHYCEIGNIKDETDVSLITGRIRETNVANNFESSVELEAKQNWALENIGHNLQDRSWKGLEQKLGETDVLTVQEGRKGIALQYSNEPE